MKRIKDGIFQLVTPFPEFDYAQALHYRHDLEASPRVMKTLPYVLPYLVKRGDDVLLVDCGWNTDVAYDALVEEMRLAGSNLDEVRTVLITHGHPDHAGMAARLQERHGTRALIHEKELGADGSLHAWGPISREDMLRWLQLNGTSQAESNDLLNSEIPYHRFVADLRPDEALKGGEEIRVGELVFEVIWTPGHTPGHVCLYEKNHKLLLTGDHVLPTITPNVSLDRRDGGNPLAVYIESLRKIEALDVAEMLPAHEWDVTWFKRRIAEIRGHHEARLEAMMTAVGSGDSTARDVAGRVQWTTGTYDEFPALHKMAAIGETLAHLEYLVERGGLRLTESNGVVSFSRN
jgi:glyoxylase-like metal-dependent hydrolase (beta-lactamase superfamily II)